MVSEYVYAYPLSPALPGVWVSHGPFSKHLPGLSLNLRTCRDQTVIVCSELEKPLRWGFEVHTSGYGKSLKSLIRSSPFLLTASGNCILKENYLLKVVSFKIHYLTNLACSLITFSFNTFITHKMGYNV